jgi:hypothetical protein
MKTLALDLDGVLSAYTGWKGSRVPIDPPLPGAVEFLSRCVAHGFAVVIFTTRSEEMVLAWLYQYAPEVAPQIVVNNIKGPAWLYIDDRALRFTGTYPTIEEMEAFKPWWQKEEQK